MLTMLLGLIGTLIAGGTLPARADCGDAVTDDRCDFRDRASGRMPAETWSDYYERRQAEVERQYAMPDQDADQSDRKVSDRRGGTMTVK